MKESQNNSILNMYEEDIEFNEGKFYNKVKEYLNNLNKIKSYPTKSCIIYMTEDLDKNQIPYHVILYRKGWDDIDNLTGVVGIQKNHPLEEEIRNNIERIIREKTN